MKFRLTELLTIGTIIAAIPALAQTYTLQDLGTAPGSTISKGYALNDLGQACGVSVSGIDIAALFSGGKASDLGAFNSSDVTVAMGISKSAVVVGWEDFSAESTDHAVIWRNGTIQDIHSASLFPAGTMATAINGSGVVVGQGNLTSSSFHVFVYSGGQMVDIGPSDAYQAVPSAINDAGEIVGSLALTSGGGGAFLYSGGKFTLLASPSGTTANAQGINSSGEIAGTLYFNNGNPAHAASYSNGL